MERVNVAGAQRLADRFVERLDIKPPVNVAELVARYASIHDLPEDVPELDAVLLALDSDEKLVFMNRERNPRRRRFTMAHELGHILIPWHQAHELICEADREGIEDPDKLLRLPGSDPKSREIRTQELQADAFAARTLVPKRFVDSLMGQGVDRMLEAQEAADVSAPAGMWALADSLPAGYVFAMLDNEDRVQRSWRSGPPRSGVPTVLGITKGETIDMSLAGRTLAEDGRAWHYDRMIWWGRADIDVQINSEGKDWRPLLGTICDDVTQGPSERSALWTSVYAIGGALVSDIDEASVNRLAGLLIIRLKRRTALHSVVAHPLFDDFVRARSLDLNDALRAKNGRRSLVP